MSTHRFFIDHPIRAKRVKIAVGCCCEICGSILPLEGLEIHALDPGREAMRAGTTPSGEEILVLCFRCHEDVHEFLLPLEEQAWIVGMRDAEKRKKIREILSYVPRSYTPPESDIEEAYREACSSRFRFGV